ncbi:hypothetical protein [Ralstonia soli]|uniref:Transmembrane protein n=1 Tax=Ralstonia soli TaxID=2953896 RepID=A0ABT1AHL4_9RALS|nr:hypothetical protein [Ralstonia soli]MCO5397888.1 hypothetical protein [Ralstonia soli]
MPRRNLSSPKRFSLTPLATPALGLSLQGCAHGAPSYAIFGAYFPLWLLAGLIGAAGALIAHRVLVMTGWSSWMPFQLSVCVAIGVMVAVVVWLIGAGHWL